MSTISPKAITAAEAIHGEYTREWFEGAVKDIHPESLRYSTYKELFENAELERKRLASIIEEHMGNPEGLLGPQEPKRECCADDGRVKRGWELIRDEKMRQIYEEGWTAEHDDTHTEGEMAAAAACYAQFASDTAYLGPNATRRLSPPQNWPWDRKWWKPHSTIHDLVRAGALIAAEIDRLHRIQTSNPKQP